MKQVINLPQFLVLFLCVFIQFIKNKTLSDCIPDKKCYDESTDDCVEIADKTISGIKEYISDKKDNEKLININQIHCGSAEEICINTVPTEGIMQDCSKVDVEGKKCCYMRMSFENNKVFSCYPAPDDKAQIKGIIENLKEKYEGLKSASIKCKGTNLGISLIAGLIYVLLI